MYCRKDLFTCVDSSTMCVHLPPKALWVETTSSAHDPIGPDRVRSKIKEYQKCDF